MNKIEYDKNGLVSEEISIIESEITNRENEIVDACIEDIKDCKEAAAERDYDSWKESLEYWVVLSYFARNNKNKILKNPNENKVFSGVNIVYSFWVFLRDFKLNKD